MIFLGGKNINNIGYTGAYVASLMVKLLDKMHADFPDAEIHYIYPMAVPNCYKNGAFNYEYGRFIEEMKAIVENTDWLNVIDMFDTFTLKGEVRTEYFRDDGIHLNADGYDEFARIINEAVFNNKT